MFLKELKEKINAIDSKFDDCHIMVDTDAAEFMTHLVDITGVQTQNIGEDVVVLSLDNEVKNYTPGKKVCSRCGNLVIPRSGKAWCPTTGREEVGPYFSCDKWKK